MDNPLTFDEDQAVAKKELQDIKEIFPGADARTYETMADFESLLQREHLGELLIYSLVPRVRVSPANGRTGS